MTGKSICTFKASYRRKTSLKHFRVRAPLDPRVHRSWMHHNDGSRDAGLTSQKPVTYVFLCRMSGLLKNPILSSLVYHKPEAVAEVAPEWDWVTRHPTRPLCGVACHSAWVFKAKPHGRYLGAAKGVLSFLPHAQAARTRQAPSCTSSKRRSRYPMPLPAASGVSGRHSFPEMGSGPCTQARSLSSQGRRATGTCSLV